MYPIKKETEKIMELQSKSQEYQLQKPFKLNSTAKKFNPTILSTKYNEKQPQQYNEDQPIYYPAPVSSCYQSPIYPYYPAPVSSCNPVSQSELSYNSCYQPSRGGTLMVINSGKPLINDMSFKYYLDDKQVGLSDHTPILYDNIGTWNIANQMTSLDDISGRIINHRFEINDAETFSQSSELYYNRLNNIASKIKELFLNNPEMEYLALQELPYHVKDMEFFIEKLKPDYKLLVFKNTSNNKYYKQGIVLKQTNRNLENIGTPIDRYCAFYESIKKELIVSIHPTQMPFDLFIDDIEKFILSILKSFSDISCKGLKRYKEIIKITVIGDFNIQPSLFDKEYNLIVQTTDKSYYSSDNFGKKGSENIDLCVDFSYILIP